MNYVFGEAERLKTWTESATEMFKVSCDAKG